MILNIKKFFLILILLTTTIQGSNPIKISIVERITRFIEWPFLDEKFIIGIYKNKNLKDQMIEIYSDKLIHDREIEVFNITNPNDKRIDQINLLYFTKESSKDVDKIFKRIKENPILIITDFPNDVYQGMHLGLYYKNKKLKFIINQDALENAKLKASYKILKLAKIVKEEK